MIHGIWTIYRKELIDTLRDRRTLIFMLLLPVLALPLMMFGINKIVDSAVRQQQSQVVKVAADPASQAAYLQLVHEWFKDTNMAQTAAGAQNLAELQETGRNAFNAFQTLLNGSPSDDPAAQDEGSQSSVTQQALEEALPAEVLTDPVAFQAWAAKQAEKLRDDIDIDQAEETLKERKLSKTAIKEGVDFYRVALKGLGLVEFVDPSSLEEPPADFVPPELPDDVQGLDEALVRKVAWAIRNKKIHGYLQMPPKDELGETPVGDQQLKSLMVHDSTLDLSDEAFSRVARAVREGSKSLALERLRTEGLDIRYQDPIKVSDESDLATDSDLAMKIIGGILPYLVIAFAFLGGMYPAIDIGAGEKERNTLETLILAPSTRTEIAIGKFLVIFTSSVTASLLGLASMAASFKYVANATLLSNLQFQISPTVAISVALLVIPPAAMFAGLFLAISIYARSFKEAQSYMAPLQFVLILPALAPALPGMEMSWKVAFIPLVNVAMLTKEFLKGNIHWGYYGVTISTCLAAAAVCVLFAVWQFRREEVLFRT